MGLINTFGRIKITSELILMGSLAILLADALRIIFRPVRLIRKRLAAIQMSNLNTAIISVDGQPSELVPILRNSIAWWIAWRWLQQSKQFASRFPMSSAHRSRCLGLSVGSESLNRFE